MAANTQLRSGSRRTRSTGRQPKSLHPSRRNAQRKPGPLDLNLGIDFGTSFTKVSFRDLGTEEAIIVTFGSRTPERAMIPSIVNVGDRGRLSLFRGGTPVGGASVPYLKMRLAGTPIGDKLPASCGVDLGSERAVRALSSWFLASVIVRARKWIQQDQAERIRGRKLNWSANVGVPVEYCDSSAINVFEDVLAVAWDWVADEKIPTHIKSALGRYEESVCKIDRERTDCHAVPEIAAAVQSFLISRDAAPGIYVYFDIGGGTLDGVVFDYPDWNGPKRINFYSGKVASLGVASLAARFGGTSAERWEAAFAANRLGPSMRQKLDPAKLDIQKLVAEVIMTAKRKDHRDWQRDKIQHRLRKFIGPLQPSSMMPLLIFVGGGGAGSKWYHDAILGTYTRFKHANAGIPPYKLAEVPKPTDLHMNGLDDLHFRRFSIAYGLSVPVGEGPDFSLPTEVKPLNQKVRTRQKALDYFDSKDAYD